jgi:hypothetical protein
VNEKGYAKHEKARSTTGDARSKPDGARSVAGEEESTPMLDLHLEKID